MGILSDVYRCRVCRAGGTSFLSLPGAHTEGILSVKRGAALQEGTESKLDIAREGENCLRAAGIVRLDRIGEELGMVLEHEEVDTISGLILMLLERPPEVGDRVSYGRISCRVLLVEGHGVKECLITLEPGACREEAPPVKGEE